MSQLVAISALAGPVLLLACLFVPARQTAFVRRVGVTLPWFALAGSIIAAVELAFAGSPVTLRLSLMPHGPLADLTILLIDPLSVTLLLLVGFLGAVIARFSRNYMAGEPREGHFYKWLAATVGSVLCVVISGNLLLFTMAWMATSLSLHHLLVFYRERPAALLAAHKKFIISRLGDVCLIATMIWVASVFGTLDFLTLFEQAEAMFRDGAGMPEHHLHGIALLLVSGALLKSAQFPFHTWLPDTLETPTPVSALMHAGIINAGGYLVVRLSPLVVLSTPSLVLLAAAGAFTAVFAGLVMLTQTSLKKSLAFSTVAQMGFMMLQCGLGAFAFAVLHIVAHSLYKAHAFLGSGALPRRRAGLAMPSAGTFLACAAVALFAFVVCSRVTGNLQASGSYIWVLGFVFVLGLVHFMALSLSGGARLGSMRGLRAAASAVAIAGLYGLLHNGAKSLLGGSVASAPELTASAQGALYGGIGLLFAYGFAVPLAAEKRPRSPFLRRLYLHASHGFYCNTWVNAVFQPKQVGRSIRAARAETPASESGPGLEGCVERACGLIAPLWPLDHFVAVNPYLGYRGAPFAESARHLKRAVDAEAVPALEFFAPLLRNETITDDLLDAAIRDAPEAWHRSLRSGGIARNAGAVRGAALDPAGPAAECHALPTFAAFYDSRDAGYWQRLITEDISRRCAAFFDPVQSVWRFPFDETSLFDAWRASMPSDHNMDAAGIPGFREAVGRLPRNPRDAIDWSLGVLRVPDGIRSDFLYAELFSLRGWAGYGQYLRHEARLADADDGTLVDLLAIRLVYDALLFQTKADEATGAAWEEGLKAAARVDEEALPPELALRCVLLEAFERCRREPLFEALTAHGGERPQAKGRAKLHAVFCIDARSEIYRRALEAQSARIETSGFAGFFGIPVRFDPRDGSPASSRCPALIAPQVDVAAAHCAHPEYHAEAWRAFQKDAPSCFPYVETVGLGYVWKILAASFARCPPEASDDASAAPADRLDAGARTDVAAAVLKNLGLTEDFASFVLFAGHGSRTRNNPHATGYDCGACGGQPGDVNARVAAALLNDRAVREGLAERHGIRVPDETRFLAGLHNTTTDAVRLFDDTSLTPGERESLAEVRGWLDAASARTRRLRAPGFDLQPGNEVHRSIRRRAVDWSETRPEWGLAGNYAFIAAPRARTRGLNLGGRAFLHEYDPALDPDGAVLTLILTAPVVVASWINLQYYGSTVDARSFGAGTKVIHNIAAGLGVLAGNGGDLQTGLPAQALAATDRVVHEPLRLHVCLEASPEAIDRVLAEQESIRTLVDNRWLHLFAITDDGRNILRREPAGTWRAAAPGRTGDRVSPGAKMRTCGAPRGDPA